MSRSSQWTDGGKATTHPKDKGEVQMGTSPCPKPTGAGISFGEDKLLGMKGLARIGRTCAEGFCMNLIGESEAKEVSIICSIFQVHRQLADIH